MDSKQGPMMGALSASKMERSFASKPDKFLGSSRHDLRLRALRETSKMN